MRRGCAVLATNRDQRRTRVADEPAFVLHRYDWSESSLVLDVFTRHHGRMALVAKGAKRPHSNLRPVIMPLQPLQLNFSGDHEVRTLTGAHWLGGHVFPRGDSLLAGFYLNELLLKLMAREDPHEHLFDLYAQVVKILASGLEPTLWHLMRAFELLLLKGLGLLPNLDAQSANLQPLGPQVLYVLLAPLGLVSMVGLDDEERARLNLGMKLAPHLSAPLGSVATLQAQSVGLQSLAPQTRARAQAQAISLSSGPGAGGIPSAPGWESASGSAGLPLPSTMTGLSGEHWQALSWALNSSEPLTATLRVCAEFEALERASLQTQLRAWLTHHCGGVGLKTRQFMVDIQAL